MTETKSMCTSDPNLPSQDTCREQYLFLLEVYVREIQSRRLAKLNESFNVPTAVAFRFLDFKREHDLQLTPVDPMFEPQAGIADDVEPFYAGKSVLFALSQDDVADKCREFKIGLRVFKKMPEDIKPDVMVGCGEIDMTLEFAALRKELIEQQRYNSDMPVRGTDR